MPDMTALSRGPRKNLLASFTLIELLTVMAIIIILTSLVLFAASSVMNKAKRSRASSEIQAMSTALESYKTDNGIYPPSDGVLTTNSYTTYDGTKSNYQTNSTLLYIALSGQTNFSYAPASGVKSYMAFRANQVGNLTGPYSYIQDPWGYSYCYCTATNSSGAGATPYNGSGFFDLWSTGGLISGKQTNMNAWISNWQ
jgi:type II secretory pathway pseudopilin PulG